MKSLSTFFLTIAGLNIKILFKTSYSDKKRSMRYLTFFQRELVSLYESFLSRDELTQYDFSIEVIDTVNPEIISREDGRKNYSILYKDEGKGKLTTFGYISFPQFQIVLRYALYKMLGDQGIILHSSAVDMRGRTQLFVGGEGAGKSTIINLLGRNNEPLAGDTIIIKKEQGRFYCYQTPFIEKEPWIKKTAKRYSLGRIFFLQKANFFKAEKIEEKEEILSKMLEHTFRRRREDVKDQMAFLLKFVSKFDEFYNLYFAKDAKKMVELFENLK